MGRSADGLVVETVSHGFVFVNNSIEREIVDVCIWIDNVIIL